ncbi:MAG: hypothetical protein R3A47_07040 [Polyangiales bacterium]
MDEDRRLYPVADQEVRAVVVRTSHRFRLVARWRVPAFARSAIALQAGAAMRVGVYVKARICFGDVFSDLSSKCSL